MRHGKKFNHLSRTASHRKALLANLAKALIKHKRIRTTLAKAKALRKYVEPIINRAKYDTMHSRRMVFSYLQDKHSVKELYSNIREKIYERPGGYTRILKLGPRPGDFAEMALIELVDFNEFIEDKTKSLSSRARKRTKKAKVSIAKDANVTQQITSQFPATEPGSPTDTTSSEEQKSISPDLSSMDNDTLIAQAPPPDEITPDSDNKA
jgi:large subunit ribosomal protein L17